MSSWQYRYRKIALHILLAFPYYTYNVNRFGAGVKRMRVWMRTRGRANTPSPPSLQKLKINMDPTLHRYTVPSYICVMLLPV